MNGAPTGGLFNEEQAAAFYGVGVRKFAQLRATGVVPEPIVLGPRALRWVPAELVESLQRLPRAQSLAQPAQLRRARIERLKGSTSPATALDAGATTSGAT
jgi:predicted DNA-binding transcriptional regulator AlpA